MPSSPNFGLLDRIDSERTLPGIAAAAYWAIIPPIEIPPRWNVSMPSSSAHAPTAAASVANVVGASSGAESP